MLFEYPKQAAFNQVIHKTKLYSFGKPGRRVRERIVSEIDQIVWKYKLAPETTNLSAVSGVPEIQILGISLKTANLHEDVLRCIDKAISFPIFYELYYNHQVKVTAAYKRPSEGDASKWVVDQYFETEWFDENASRHALPVALNLGKLYEQMLQVLMPLPPRENETIKNHVARMNEVRIKEREKEKIEARLTRENQFNRKVEINQQLRNISQELEALKQN